MALTLIEYAKAAQQRGETVNASTIEIFARSSPVLNAMPFLTIGGLTYRYNQQAALPGVAFRALNAGFTESTGVLNPVAENLYPAGGDIDVDKMFVNSNGGPQVRAVQTEMKMTALAQSIHYTLIKGDQTTNALEPDGLQARLGGTQVISNGNTSGGDPLSLSNLLLAIQRTDNANAIIAGKDIIRLLTIASMSTTITGFVTHTTNSLGQAVTSFAGLPILVADGNSIATGYQALGFNEAGSGGGTTATSIYVVSFGMGRLFGIQGNEGLRSTDLGELETKPAFRQRVEWDVGFVLEHPRAATRLRDISNAAVAL